MPNSAIGLHQDHCRCGALRETASTHCKKCRDRSRWYRRKAWRINPEFRIDPATTRKGGD